MARKKLHNAAAANREAATKRSRSAHAAAADIGEIPEVVNPKRRAACEADAELFLRLYFPNSTGLSPFSDDHKRMIDRIERCIREGGRFVNAVYRGIGKTSISTNLAIRAVVYALRRYVVVFSASERQAEDLIASIKTELSENDLLYEDFPEVCHAFRALEGKSQRCHSQSHGVKTCDRCKGKGGDCLACKGEGTVPKLTHIGYRADRVVMPSIEGSKASGAIIASRGMTGSGTRGLLHTMPDGTKQRPDMVIIDDPQTAETASTPGQVKKRLDIIKRDIMKLAGHRRTMACVVNATVIAPDDLVLQLLDPKRNKAWQGERIKMVRQWADAHETLWMGTADSYEGESYSRIRNTFNREDPADQQRAIREATEFYLANRDAMDAGCIVSWDSCYSDEDGEVSAIQHAYNFLIDDGPEVFATECQNEVPAQQQQDAGLLEVSEITTKVNGYPRGLVPQSAAHLTAFIDISQSVLWWMVCGWCPNFTGFVLDYGTYPDQKRNYFTLMEVAKPLESVHKGGIEAQLRAGLEALTKNLLGREWQQDGGGTLKIGRCLVDANWEVSTSLVYEFCRQSPHAAVLMPSHGKGIGLNGAPMHAWQKKDGEQVGLSWRVRRTTANRAPIRHAIYETNFWKSFVHARLFQPIGDPGSVTLFKAEPHIHQMLADQLAAERREAQESSSGRKVDVWDVKRKGIDNHWLDCFVGCAVGASMLGASLAEHQAIRQKPRRKMTIKF